MGVPVDKEENHAADVDENMSLMTMNCSRVVRHMCFWRTMRDGVKMVRNSRLQISKIGQEASEDFQKWAATQARIARASAHVLR